MSFCLSVCVCVSAVSFGEFHIRIMHPAPSLGPTPTRYCHPNSYPTNTKHIQVGFVRGLTNHINVAKFIRYERHTHTHTHHRQRLWFVGLVCALTQHPHDHRCLVFHGVIVIAIKSSMLSQWCTVSVTMRTIPTLIVYVLHTH